jgi:hypothetical protein
MHSIDQRTFSRELGCTKYLDKPDNEDCDPYSSADIKWVCLLLCVLFPSSTTLSSLPS